MTADQLTTDTAGCSPVALAIAKRICGVDLIAQRVWTEDWDHAAFAAEVARMVDQELDPVVRTAAAFAALTVEYRPGLKHRVDLITRDERNMLQAAAEALTP